MCHEVFLKYIRVCPDGDDFYIHTEFRAMMKKSVTYFAAIKLSKNVIMECQCECAAGMGPTGHCKHILFG